MEGKQGPNKTTVLGDKWTKRYQIWARYKTIIGAPEIRLDFRLLLLLDMEDDTKATGFNTETIFRIFTPVKLGEGGENVWVSFFVISLEPNLWALEGRGSAPRSVMVR